MSGASAQDAIGGGSRAFWPGSRATRIAVALVVVLGGLFAYLAISSASHSNPLASLRYGKIPSWLPSAKPPPNQIVTATEGRPVLAAIEGDTVHTEVPGGSAMVTVVGPAIPSWVSHDIQLGRWDDDDAAPSTFTVTFADVSGAVPLRASAFQILTTDGRVIRPSVTAAGGRPLPAELTPGKSLTLTMRAGLSEGEGALRWIPVGDRVLAAWTYELELD